MVEDRAPRTSGKAPIRDRYRVTLVALWARSSRICSTLLEICNLVAGTIST